MRIGSIPAHRPEAHLSKTAWLVAVTAIACSALAIYGAISLSKGQSHGKIVLAGGLGLSGIMGLALLMRHSSEQRAQQRARAQAEEQVQEQHRHRAA